MSRLDRVSPYQNVVVVLQNTRSMAALGAAFYVCKLSKNTGLCQPDVPIFIWDIQVFFFTKERSG
jgi:hypothetical protein